MEESSPPSATSDRRSKHRVVYEALRDEMRHGSYPQGSRMPSESELVVRFGASRPTVARALLDLQHEGLVERRAGSGTFARAAAAASPHSSAVDKQAGMFGLILPEL